MLPIVTRGLKRVGVLLIGALFIYIAVWRIFPFFHHRTSLAISLFATYIAMAYVIIPLLFRVFRFFWRPTHLPLYCTTPDGFASDPINIALVGTREQVIAAMNAAGWELADAHTLVNIARQILSVLTNKPYPTAPMSKLYLFGRHQDFGFEVQLSHARGMRHHVRFWAADLELASELTHHVHFWQRFYKPSLHTPNVLFWVGAASKDSGFAPIRHNAQITHMIDPDTNAERELIVHNLKKAKKLKSHRTVTVHHPFSLQNRAWRGYLHSDGRIAICRLR